MSRCPVKNCSRVASHRSGLCLPHAREGMRLFIVHATIPAQAHALEILYRLDLAGQAEKIEPLRARLAEVEQRLELQARQCADCADRREQLVAELAAEQRAHAETREIAHERAETLEKLEEVTLRLRAAKEEIARTVDRERSAAREAEEWRARAEQAEQRQEASAVRMVDRTVEKMAELEARLEAAVRDREAASRKLWAAEEELRLLRRRMRDEPSALRRPAESSGVRRG